MATEAAVAVAFNSIDELLYGICEKLQLGRSDYGFAEDCYKGIGAYLDQHPLLAQYRPEVYPQGSVRLGTTVKPRGRQEYDVDLVCELQLDPSRISNPVAVLDLVQASLASSRAYAPLLERKDRCIRLKYTGRFHLDVLPACPDLAAGGTCVLVPDCEARAWKASNPKGYAKWFEGRCRTSEQAILAKAAALPEAEAVGEKAPLKLVVQLFKRARDIRFANKADLAPRSIILTTLCAIHYTGEMSVADAVGNVLRGVLNSIALASPRRLVVPNPMNNKEDFSESWAESARYMAFLDFVREFGRNWELLQLARGIHNVRAILEKLFGEDVTNAAVEEQIRTFNRAREEQSLGLAGAGILTHVLKPQAVSIPKHTYHGR